MNIERRLAWWAFTNIIYLFMWWSRPRVKIYLWVRVYANNYIFIRRTGPYSVLMFCILRSAIIPVHLHIENNIAFYIDSIYFTVLLLLKVIWNCIGRETNTINKNYFINLFSRIRKKKLIMETVPNFFGILNE